ncbi:MAG: iron export ABC transporter permease subunit FetB [Myxococcota bacterium]
MSELYVRVSVLQLVATGALVLLNFALSAALGLGLSRSLAVASTRMVVQLLLVGLVLEWLFQMENPLFVIGVGFVMSVVAGRAAVSRSKRRFAGAYWDGFVSVFGASVLVTGVVVGGILRVEPWYAPQYVIPMLGMVLGNTLNGISLALDRLTEELQSQAARVEALLALGALRWEAAKAPVRAALRTGMTPIINAMTVMGLVSLPGMMTGQILAGRTPDDAVRYQIVIAFMIVAATALGTLAMVLLAYRRLMSPDHRLRLDRLQ